VTWPPLEGPTLEERLCDGPLPPQEAAALAEKVALALQVAHDQGVLHRDLTPACIRLTTAGDPMVTGFELARRKGSSRETVAGQVLGTPGYLAPERRTGQPGADTPAADVYSLGAVLYEMLTGRPLFGRTMPEVLEAPAALPAPPSGQRPEVPADLDAVCLKALAPSPADRHDSMTALADDLRRFLQDIPAPPAQRSDGVRDGRKGLARSAASIPRTSTGRRARRLASYGLVLLFLGAGVGLVARWYLGGGGEAVPASESDQPGTVVLDSGGEAQPIQATSPKAFPESTLAGGHNDLGLGLAAKGRLDDAIQEYRTAIALDPNFASAHNNLGDALKAKGRLDDAIQEYRTAIGLDPNVPGFYHNLGLALVDKGRWDDAVEACRKAAALDPQNPWAHYSLGWALCDRRRLDDAIRLYRRAIALNAKDAWAHQSLSWP
jgi:tetratricopeptide (TPR) repeat protein